MLHNNEDTNKDKKWLYFRKLFFYFYGKIEKVVKKILLCFAFFLFITCNPFWGILCFFSLD